MGENAYDPIIIQPYSYPIVSKNYLISLALMETPVILTVVVAVLVFDLLAFTESVLLSLLPTIYLFLFSISASLSIYFSGISIPSLLSAFGAHPQYESSFLMQFLVFSSSIQAPFIIFFVALLYHKYYILNNIDCLLLLDGHILFVICKFFMILIMQYALIKGISKIIFSASNIYINYPENAKHIFILLIMQIGFLQAPFIFSFICFILLFQVFIMKFNFLYYLFSFLAICFGISGYLVIRQSSKVVLSSLKNANYKIEKNKSIMAFSILSQVLLDSRILYILLIILFSLNFFS
jgi:F0F1-type ATP synthase membrane subunit c/vacuolar-type H+-ATPase subunit K